MRACTKCGKPGHYAKTCGRGPYIRPPGQPLSSERRRYISNWLKKNRSEVRAALLKDKVCSSCGRTEKLEIIPVPPDPVYAEHASIKARREMLSGLRQYRVLCRWCHAKESHAPLVKSGFYSRIGRIRYS